MICVDVNGMLIIDEFENVKGSEIETVIICVVLGSNNHITYRQPISC